MKRVWLVLGAAIVLAVGAATGYVLYKRHEARNIHGSSSVEFVTTAAAPRPVVAREFAQIPWPLYGFDAARLHVGPSRVRPPFRRLWVAGGRSLLEFPPVIGYRRLFLTDNAGNVLAYDAKTGSRAWIYRSGRCAAASPAVGRFDQGTVYQPFLNPHPCNRSGGNLDGELVAFSAGYGKVRWVAHLGPSETPPLLADGLVYVGDWRGKVYALEQTTGRVRWSFATGGKVKGGMSLFADRVYFGSYDGHVYCLSARSGRLIWRAAAQARLGPTGTFYATPAVAYDRVYIGSTDGKMYSYGASTGRLRWSHGTGGYVYAAPAVWHERVLVGSYSGTFYAFDAATGDVRWQFQANGPISGAATVVDGTVYFSTLRARTYGLDATTGRQVWIFRDGAYSPVVADARRLYLTGYSTLYGLAHR